jgi:osmoprotectant transport system ATP-binding protein
VLQPTTLEIPPGATTVLIGPSGCGKSTLLRMIAGLVTPDGGEILADGRPVAPDSLPELRRRLGYVIQDGGLFPHLSARGNVTLMARHLGWEKERIGRRLEELCDLARLPSAWLDRYPVQLSGGQRQRVGIMRALFLDPELLLFDEPLGALDPLVRYELQEDLRRIFRSLQKTVVLVTHDLGEAQFFADTVVLLRAGRIVQRGRFTDLVDAPADPDVMRFLEAQRLPDLRSALLPAESSPSRAPEPNSP